MKIFIICALVAVACAARLQKAQESIPGSYIIRLKDTVSLGSFVKSADFTKLNAQVIHKYESINGLAVRLPSQFIDRLLNVEGIDFVEEDGVAYTQAVASWGIDRVDQRQLPLDGSYTPSGSASDVTIYIVDTGLRHSHVDYGGRASYHWDYDTRNGGDDCNGHGTHCGGTAGGTTYGLARGSNLKSVRVLSCSGSGSWSNVIAGIESVGNAQGKRVGSLSLGGGASSSVDDAVEAAVGNGAVMSVAAGNSNANACNYSPARTPSAITVGSTTSSDTRSSFSNYGKCVDIFAPGSSITSSWHTSDTATNTISGTSMACPHVSGAAALLLSRGVAAGTVPETMVTEATKNVVSNPGWNSPNEFLYVS